MLRLSGRAAGEQMLHQLTSSIGSSVLRGLVHGEIDNGIRRETGHTSLFQQAIVQTLVWVQVVIFEVQAFQHGIAPVSLLRLPVRFKQPKLRRPIDSPDERGVVTPEILENGVPLSQYPIRFIVLSLAMGGGGSQKLFLNIDRRNGFARLQPDQPFALLILRNLLQR